MYDSVPKDLYDRAKAAWYKNDISEFEEWQLGCIGFLASFNGKGFQGGFAKPGYEKTKNGERYRDYYRESKDNLLKQAQQPLYKDIHFKCHDYRDYNPKGYVIYCDPPYAQTTQYSNSKSFDYDEFWEWCRKQSERNIILISELQAPDDFDVIWEGSVSRSLNASGKSRAVEKLFKYKGEY